MSLIDHLLKSSKVTPLVTPEDKQIKAVADFEASCKRLRDATKPAQQISPAEHLWSDWWEKSERVRNEGLDPLD